jgi:hypothetical protein
MHIEEFDSLLADIMAEHNELTIDMSTFGEWQLETEQVARLLAALKRAGRVAGFVLIKQPSGAAAFFVLRSVQALTS